MPPSIRPPSAALAAVFSPLEGAGRAELVAQRLSEAILLGLLPDGERLPSEPVLAKLLGVATVTAREALEALRDKGLVKTTRGRDGGSFVTYTGQGNGRDVEVRLRLISRVELRDSAIHYAAIAGMSAELAAEHASPDDLVNIKRVVDGIDPAREASARRGQGAFNLEVAALSQSARLVREELTLQAEIGALLWLCLREQDYRDRSHAAQLNIMAAIEAVDGDSARHLTVGQITDAVTWLIDTKASLDVEGTP